MKVRLMLLIALGNLFWFGCGNDTDEETDEDAPAGAETGATCDKALTFADDVAPIMNQYCTRCHASTLRAGQRNNAPVDHDFDSEAGVLDAKTHIDESAGSGPKATNTTMPPAGYPAPTVEERATLSKWLACQPE